MMVQSPKKRKLDTSNGDATWSEEWQRSPPYARTNPDQSKKALYTGSCHCKSVMFELYAEPKGAQYCQ
jgi:hypothetical protein